MPFSIQSLNTVVQDIKEGLYYKNDLFIENLSLACNYLSGQTSQLPSFQVCDYNSRFSDLAILFKESMQWTANDDLLVSLLQVPVIQHEIATHFPNTLLFYFDNLSDPGLFNKVLQVFRKMGNSEDQILQYLCHNMYFPDYANGDLGQDVIQYVLKGLKDASPVLLSSIFSPNNAFEWNNNLFVLMEMSFPEKTGGYLQNIFAQSQGWQHKEIVSGVLALNYHKFYPYIEAMINQTTSSTMEQVDDRFELRLIAFDADPSPKTEVIAKYAEEYLERYVSQVYDRYYESRMQVRGTDDEERFYRVSTWAFYFVMKSDRKKALRFIQRMFENKYPVTEELIELIGKYYPEEALHFILHALNMDTQETGKRGYYQRLLQMLKKWPAETYINELWKVDSFKSKAVKELIALHLIDHDPTPIPKAIPLLDSKKADVRLAGVIILSGIGTDEATAALKQLLDKEKNDDARDAILYSLGDSLFTSFTEKDIDTLVDAAKQRGKLNKPLVEWLEESALPPLYLQSGRALTADEIRFVLYRMSRTKEMRSDVEVKPILHLADRERSADFAKKILKLFGDNGYDAKYKYLMGLAALVGNEEVVDKLKSAINEWIEGGRKVMSEYGIAALAIQGSNKALRWVEWYSRKYRTKKSYAGAAALNALQAAADELGISMHELGDRIVPDFGFEGLFKTFTAGGEEYRAFIDSNFKLAFFNEDNKKIKSVPASASAEIKEEFKNIAKEVRDIVKSQSMRLEHYLITQRRWKPEDWQSFFLQNPVMFIYATKILWAISVNGQIRNFFHCQEDTTLVNMDDEEIELNEEMEILMAHPYFMEAEDLRAWQQKFFDLSIEPIFPQLDRAVIRIEQGKEETKIIRDYEGIGSDNGAIRSALERNGWGKGQTGDGGYLTSFIKDDFESSIQAVLEVEGVFVGYGYDHEPKTGRLYFINKHVKKGNSYWFNEPKDEDDERLVKLKDLPPVFYSEVISDIMSIKNSKQ